MPRPIFPNVESGAVPVFAECWRELSKKGKPFSFRCHTSKWSADHTAPFVEDAGRLVANGLPQYAQMKSFVDDSCGIRAQTVDVPFVFHSSTSKGIGAMPPASVKRKSPPVGEAN